MPYGNYDPSRNRWRRCDECGDSYTDQVAHRRSHVVRPTEDSLTVKEVSKATGIPITSLRYEISKNRLRGVFFGRGNGNGLYFVRRKHLRDYLKELIERKPELATKFAETGLLSG